MAMHRPASERILPNAGQFASKQRLKRLGEKKAGLKRGGESRKDMRKFRIVAGGGAYGLRRVVETPPPSSLSLRVPTPDLIPTARSQSSLRVSTSRTRLVLRRKPLPLPSTRRPLKREYSAAGLGGRRAGFTPEYLRELGNMLRLQVRTGEETEGSSAARADGTSAYLRDPK